MYDHKSVSEIRNVHEGVAPGPPEVLVCKPYHLHTPHFYANHPQPHEFPTDFALGLYRKVS